MFNKMLNRIKKIDYKSFWTKDKLKNIIPLNYGPNPEGWDPVYELQHIIKKYPQESILDFGCGYGRLSKAFDKEKYIGIDLSSNALIKARELNPEYRYEETYVDIDSYPNVDFCLAYTVFLHLDDTTLDNILSKLTKSTKKNFVIAEILGREWRRNGLPPVFNGERQEYENMMKKYGYVLVEEIRKPYKRYVDDPNFSDKKNKELSFLIFENYGAKNDL